MKEAEAVKIADEIMSLYKSYGNEDYIGEPVSQIEHMCQCAQLAARGHFDNEVVLAAFFHDIGHLCEHIMEVDYMDDYGITDHEKIGADYLAGKGFSRKITRLIESHVAAKRYLTYKHPSYYEKLSEASKQTLTFQGGRMNEEEAKAFEQEEWFHLYLTLRGWDEQAKEEHVPLPDLEKYRIMMIDHLTQKNNMSVQLVVFDIAGTTVADKGNINEVFRKAFTNAGLTDVDAADVDEVMGYRKIDAVRTIVKKYKPEAANDEAFINTIHDDFTQQMVSYYETCEELVPLPFAEKVFKELQAHKVKVALNTGFTKAITAPILQRLGWDKASFINDVICSDEVQQGRPYPYMIDQLMHTLKVSYAEDVVKVGDTKVDIEEGRNSGCGVVVAVTTGAYTKEALARYHPDYIIDSLEQLPSLIL